MSGTLRAGTFTVFANPGATARSWYPTLRSRAVSRRQVRAFELRDRRIALFRDADGAVHAIDARCPHLGADLTLGTVDGARLRCVFHGWRVGADGACGPSSEGTSRRRVRAYPCQERWGLIWIFNGPEATFPLPVPDPGHRWWSLVLPPQRIGCHPHLVLANGLDVRHYDTLHDMEFACAPALAVDGHEVSVTLCGRPRTRFWRAIAGTGRGDIAARFATLGGSLAWATVTAPVRFHVLFSGRPDREGGCLTRTILIVPRGRPQDALRAAGLMAVLLHDDRRVLDTIDFRPEFSDGDEPLRAFAGVVDALGAW